MNLTLANRIATHFPSDSYPIHNAHNNPGGKNMAQNKTQMRKTIGWASFALGAFTAISVIVPIIWDHIANRQQRR
jgi:hypothetical protein